MKRLGIARRVGHLLRGAAALLFLVAAAGCGGGGEATTTVAAEVPTTVFGRQARELAVGIATERRGHAVDVTTTVLAQDGTRRRGLRVALAAGGGSWVPAPPCGAGRYCGVVAVDGPQPVIRVRLARPRGPMSTVGVRLPSRPQPERAAAIVHASGAAVRALQSLIVNERLAAGPPYKPLVTQFSYIAPDRMSYRITGGGESVVIGSHRWDRRNATSPWVASTQEPIDVPAPDWRRVRDASLLGTRTQEGRRVELVSFFDPTVPAWFEAEIDSETNLPLRLRMIGAAHFMTHVYGAFNAPLKILPPDGA